MAKAKAKKPATDLDSAPTLAGPSKKNERRAKSSERQAQLSRDLAMEIDALRVMLTEMLDRFRFKIDAELLQIGSAARGETPLDTQPTPLPLAATQRMLKLVRDVQIKPKKGRAKDFQRLQDLVADLSDELPTEK